MYVGMNAFASVSHQTMIACQKMILLRMKTCPHLCMGIRTYYTAISVPLKRNNPQIHCLLGDVYMHCIPSEKLFHFTQRGETGREAYNPQKVDEMRARSTQRSTGILEAAHTVSISSIIKRKRQKDKECRWTVASFFGFSHFNHFVSKHTNRIYI